MGRLHVIKTNLDQIETDLETFKETLEGYYELYSFIKENITLVYEYADEKEYECEPVGKGYPRQKRRVHILRDRLELYNTYTGEDLVAKTEEFKQSVVEFKDKLSKLTYRDDISEVKKKFFDTLTSINVYKLNSNYWNSIFKYKQTIFNLETEHKYYIRRVKVAKDKFFTKMKGVLRVDTEGLTLEEALALQPRVQKAADKIRNNGGYGTFTPLTGKIAILKEERARKVLKELGMSDDTVEVAIAKGLYYAHRHDALKNFRNILKLAEAKEQAEIIKLNIGYIERTEDNTNTIQDSIRGYIRAKQLVEASEAEILAMVKEEFGIDKEFKPSVTRGHYKPSIDKWIAPYVRILFN